MPYILVHWFFPVFLLERYMVLCGLRGVVPRGLYRLPDLLRHDSIKLLVLVEGGASGLVTHLDWLSALGQLGLSSQVGHHRNCIIIASAALFLSAICLFCIFTDSGLVGVWVCVKWPELFSFGRKKPPFWQGAIWLKPFAWLSFGTRLAFIEEERAKLLHALVCQLA